MRSLYAQTSSIVLDTSTRDDRPPIERVPVHIGMQKPLHCIELCSTPTGAYVKLDAATDIALGTSCLSAAAYESWLASFEQYDALHEFAALKMKQALDQEKKAYEDYVRPNAQTKCTAAKESSVQRYPMDAYACMIGDAANDMLQFIEQDAIAHHAEDTFRMDEEAQSNAPSSVAPVTVHSLWAERACQSDLKHPHVSMKSPVSILQSSLSMR